MAKAIRILVYEGSDFWIEASLVESYVQPSVPVKMGNDAKITEIFRGVYPDNDNWAKPQE